jgi:hypothetical protein
MGLDRWTVYLLVDQDFDGKQIVVAAVVTAVAAFVEAVPIEVETGFASILCILLRAVFRLTAASAVVVGAVGIPAAAIGEVVVVVAVFAVVAAAGAAAAAAAIAVASVVDILVSTSDVVVAIESRKVI